MDITVVKRHLNQPVFYEIDGELVKYKLTACILRLNKKTGEFYYQAELRDIKANFSVIIVNLEDVK